MLSMKVQIIIILHLTLNTELQKHDVWLQAKKLTLIAAKTHY